MSTTIGVTEALAAKVADFVKTETLPCEVVSETSGTIRIVQSEGRQQSDSSTLQAGGWIACPDVFALASKLGIPVRTAGKLLDLVDIKIRQCQIGCF